MKRGTYWSSTFRYLCFNRYAQHNRNVVHVPVNVLLLVSQSQRVRWRGESGGTSVCTWCSVCTRTWCSVVSARCRLVSSLRWQPLLLGDYLQLNIIPFLILITLCHVRRPGELFLFWYFFALSLFLILDSCCSYTRTGRIRDVDGPVQRPGVGNEEEACENEGLQWTHQVSQAFCHARRLLNLTELLYLYIIKYTVTPDLFIVRSHMWATTCLSLSICHVLYAVLHCELNHFGVYTMKKYTPTRAELLLWEYCACQPKITIPKSSWKLMECTRSPIGKTSTRKTVEQKA